jgi:hypothetical protein
LHNNEFGGGVDSQIQFVVDRFNAMLSDDNASITVDDFDGGVLNLRYGGVGGSGEALIGKASGVTSVRVTQ